LRCLTEFGRSLGKTYFESVIDRLGIAKEIKAKSILNARAANPSRRYALSSAAQAAR
jgi:hypothetical protein